MVLKMKTDYFSPNNNNPNNNSNTIIIRPSSMNIVDGGDVEHVIDVNNYLKRGSCEHHDSSLPTSTSSCRKVKEEEFEIQQQHNKKQALECECNNIIIITKDIKDDDDGNDDDTSTCIDATTATRTSTSTTASPRVVVVVPITKKTKNNKVVRFTSECENVMYRYPRPTKEEKNDMYMSKDDYERIIMNVVEGIHNKQESNNDDNNNNSEDTDTNNDNDNENENELCIECILVQQNSDRIERVKAAISTILERQKQQKYQKQMMMTMNRNMNMNIIDDDDNDNDNDNDRHIDDNDYESWLEKYYRQPYSKLALKLAGNRGLRDQEVILSSLSPRKIVMTR